MKVVPAYSKPVAFTGDDNVKSIKKCQDFNIMTGGLKGLRKISISCGDFKMKDNGKSSQMFPLPGPKYERCLFYFHGNSMHDTEGDGDVHEMSVVETCIHSPCLKLVNPTKIKAKQGFIIQSSN